MSAWRRMDGVLRPHARARVQQRGIAPRVVQTLLDYGTVQHAHRGGRIVCFSRAARRRLLRAGEVSGVIGAGVNFLASTGHRGQGSGNC